MTNITCPYCRYQWQEDLDTPTKPTVTFTCLSCQYQWQEDLQVTCSDCPDEGLCCHCIETGITTGPLCVSEGPVDTPPLGA